MKQFRDIDYGRLLYETLRAYYAVNSEGEISILYKFLAAIVATLQEPFDKYQEYRSKEFLIASCKWQMGQLTNVLNYLYDNSQNRIFITQSVLTVVVDPMFQYPPSNFDVTFSETPTIYERSFNDKTSSSLVTINIPSGTNESDLVATIEQIRIQGIPYKINVF